jgi:hypothetical protein
VKALFVFAFHDWRSRGRLVHFDHAAKKLEGAGQSDCVWLTGSLSESERDLSAGHDGFSSAEVELLRLRHPWNMTSRDLEHLHKPLLVAAFILTSIRFQRLRTYLISLRAIDIHIFPLAKDYCTLLNSSISPSSLTSISRDSNQIVFHQCI